MKTLLIVDVQNDFIKGGTLAVPDAEQVIPVINELMDKFDLILATQDWHPEKTVHFEKWPAHCIAGSKGADFPTELHKERINQIFYKGTGNKDDGYSGFEATNIELSNYLKERGISELYLCGIALEYCIKSSVLDALKEELEVFLIRDAIANFSKEQGKIDREYVELQEAGAQIVLSHQI
jgi:nicotinamidase/pyrazinamidase